MIMDSHDLDTLLREIDRTDRPVPIDALTEEGLRRGRRRVRRHRLTVAGVLGATLASVGLIAAFSLATVPGVPTTPAAVPTPKISPSRPIPADGKRALPTAAELEQTFKALLPVRGDLRKVTAIGPGAIEFELGDPEAGYAWATGGLARTAWSAQDGRASCAPLPTQDCTTTHTHGGTLRISRLRAEADKTWYSFTRPDGTVVWFGQKKALENDEPTSRDQLLTDNEVIDLIAATEWQQLTENLPKTLSPDEKSRSTEVEDGPGR
jgi:hypothetical protein